MLQKIGKKELWGLALATCFGFFQGLKSSAELFVEPKNRRYVPTTIAVVRRRPNSHEYVLGEPVLKSLVHKLVSAGDELETVYVI
jgi:hypothetical protein